MGGCNVYCSCYTEHGRYGLSEVDSQARPFLRNADRFQYAARGGKKFDVWIYNFTSKRLNL